MTGCFIINPKSGISITRYTVYTLIRKLLIEGIINSAVVTLTECKNDARKKAAALDPSKVDFVIACGGDGTANEVLNGLMDSGSKIPMGILPLGTTNDFAVSVGLPKDPSAFAKMIKSFHVVPVDVGLLRSADNKKLHFLNVVAGGGLSAVAHKVPSEQKNTYGRVAYLLEGAKNLSSLNFDTVPLTIDCDGVIYHENSFLFEISNSQSVGGFTKIAPSAYVNDGLFNLCLVKEIDFTDLLPLLTKIGTGTHTDDSHLLITTAKKITVSSDAGEIYFPIDCDGESAFDMPITVESLPGALNLIVPDKKRSGKTIKNFKVN